MYGHTAAVLPMTGAAVSFWSPLAGAALIGLGFALTRMARTFGK